MTSQKIPIILDPEIILEKTFILFTFATKYPTFERMNKNFSLWHKQS